MIVEELLELLEEFNPEAEVRIAHQPSWPFEYEIVDVVPNGDEIADVLIDDDNARHFLNPVVYLVEGAQLGYLPHEARVAVGWAESKEQG